MVHVAGYIPAQYTYSIEVQGSALYVTEVYMNRVLRSAAAIFGDKGSAHYVTEVYMYRVLRSAAAIFGDRKQYVNCTPVKLRLSHFRSKSNRFVKPVQPNTCSYTYLTTTVEVPST